MNCLPAQISWSVQRYWSTGNGSEEADHEHVAQRHIYKDECDSKAMGEGHFILPRTPIGGHFNESAHLEAPPPACSSRGSCQGDGPIAHRHG